VSWSDDRSLGTVLDVHVVVIITISDTFEVPAGTILELSWDIEPIPVLGHPRKRWGAISVINFEQIETWAHSENDSGGSLPEFAPFADSGVLVDDFTLLEVQSGVGLHWWGLEERLELITWVGWSSLKTDDLFDGLFSQHGETESGGDVRELLVLSPLDVVLGSLLVPMVDGWPVLQRLLPSELDVEKLSGGLSPSVVVLEEHVVQMEWVGEAWGDVVHVWWHVAHFLDNTWSHLGDMHIDEKTVVSVNLNELFLAQILGVHIVLNIAVLMWQNNIWVSIFVTWCLEIVDLKVFSSLSFVDRKIEIGFGCNLGVGVALKTGLLLTRKLVFKAHKLDLLLNESRNFRFDLFDFGVITVLMGSEGGEVLLSGLDIIKHVIIPFVFGIDGGLLSEELI